jgi:integrase/recombinase XerD
LTKEEIVKYDLGVFEGKKMDFDIDLGDLEASAKIDGMGQAKILTDGELAQLFAEGFVTQRDRVLFGICMFTGSRISETLQLTAESLAGGFITFAKATRKGKTGTRQVQITPALAALLADWSDMPKTGYLFKSRRGSKGAYMSRANADLVLSQACDRLGLVGVSTHSFRRTYITKLRSKGVSPRQIQRRTGHKALTSLMPYFDQV